MTKDHPTKELVHAKKTNKASEAPVAWSAWPDFGALMEDFRRDLVDPLRLLSVKGFPFHLGEAREWRTPRTDLRDLGPNYELVAEMPGIPRDEIQVNVADDRIEIRGESTEKKEEKAKGYYHREIGHQAYLRTVPLPLDADPESVEAKLENGCLHVTLAKRDGAVVRRRVPVR